jgi:hypothetical protein
VGGGGPWQGLICGGLPALCAAPGRPRRAGGEACSLQLRLFVAPFAPGPSLPSSQPWSRLSLQDWLSDARGRDQFVARYGDETEVAWNDAPKQQAEPVYKRSFWTGGPRSAAQPHCHAATPRLGHSPPSARLLPLALRGGACAAAVPCCGGWPQAAARARRRRRLPPPCPPAESFVEWGPSGSMLATVHRQGVALWGGKSFGRLMRVG